MRITQLESIDFPPFKDLKLEFRETKSKGKLAEVQLLTGINGTGKTRILSFLAAVLGNIEPLVFRFDGTRDSISAEMAFTGSLGSQKRFINVNKSGAFASSNGGQSGTPIMQSTKLTELFKLPALAYGGGAYITDSKIAVMATVKLPEKNQLLSFQKSPSQNSILFQQLANIKMQGALDHLSGNTASKWNEVMKAIEESIREVTGQQFAFNVQAQPEPKLSVYWRKGIQPLPINLLPDGLRSLIGWMVDAATMISLARPASPDPLAEPSIILLDEPETHLHPEWQRLVLPVAQRLFPGAQIFVATHSPFIVSSVNEGWIHKLVLNDDGSVSSTAPEEAKLGDSFIDAAEDVLGMGPNKWFDPESEKLLAEFRELREHVLAGDSGALSKVEAKGKEIGERGPELANIVSAELAQLKRLMQQRKSA